MSERFVGAGRLRLSGRNERTLIGSGSSFRPPPSRKRNDNRWSLAAFRPPDLCSSQADGERHAGQHDESPEPRCDLRMGIADRTPILPRQSSLRLLRFEFVRPRVVRFVKSGWTHRTTRQPA